MEQTNHNQSEPTSSSALEKLQNVSPSVQMRVATDVAGVCREIVKNTAISIQGRKYVRVEGWQSIATAYGCVAGARDVERVQGGVRAIGELRAILNGTLIATAEGFVGEDEPKWFGGLQQVKDRTSETGFAMRELPKRPDYAIRAMAQTRAISRVCRSAFAHVVVLIDKDMSTTPAEEIPTEGFHDPTQPTDAEITDRQERREKAAKAMGSSLKTEQDLIDEANLELAEASTSRRKKKA